jgi:hypothetical protein
MTHLHVEQYLTGEGSRDFSKPVGIGHTAAADDSEARTEPEEIADVIGIRETAAYLHVHLLIEQDLAKDRYVIRPREALSTRVEVQAMKSAPGVLSGRGEGLARREAQPAPRYPPDS